jgi:hypothetical protein
MNGRVGIWAISVTFINGGHLPTRNGLRRIVIQEFFRPCPETTDFDSAFDQIQLRADFVPCGDCLDFRQHAR